MSAQHATLREDTPPGATYRHFQLVAPGGEVIRGMNATTARQYGFDIDNLGADDTRTQICKALASQALADHLGDVRDHRPVQRHTHTHEEVLAVWDHAIAEEASA